ncbi:MAG: hypothetical protein PHW87_00775 [Methanothrix sp.]|nr:hypothetical protein [Methanothrix sp.]
MEALALMLAFIELFAGFTSAAAPPKDTAVIKKQVISSNKACLIVVTGF